VVCRPEAARDDAELGFEAQRERPRELVLPVADDLDARRLEPERQHFSREVGAVQVGAVAADELAARDDDDRARARQAAAVATPRLVATNAYGVEVGTSATACPLRTR